MQIIRVGVDLAKNVFQVHGVDRNEKPVWCRRLSRKNWLKVLLETVEPGIEIGMESCSGSHYWAHQLQAQGFEVKLIAPQFVKPYVKSNKNDANDAEAVCGKCQASCRPFFMRPLSTILAKNRFAGFLQTCSETPHSKDSSFV